MSGPGVKAEFASSLSSVLAVVVCPFTMTTGGGGVASLTFPPCLSGTWRDSPLGRPGRAEWGPADVGVGTEVGADVGPDVVTEVGAAAKFGPMADVGCAD